MMVYGIFKAMGVLYSVMAQKSQDINSQQCFCLCSVVFSSDFKSNLKAIAHVHGSIKCVVKCRESFD